jgi:hypothetical protein
MPAITKEELKGIFDSSSPKKEKERIKAISIEYLPTEKELDPNAPLIVGKGLMDQFSRTEMLGYQTFFGTKRYLCGLDVEIVKYDTNLTDAEKEAKIAEIESIIARLEQFFGKGTLDPTNEKHWSKIELRIDRKTTNLDLTNPRTELVLHCIRGGGFTMVSPTLEKARETGTQFYLVEPIEYAENRIANKEIINKAISTLQKIYESKSFDDIFFLGKYILPVEKSYTKRTPKAMIYEDLDKYLNGEVVKQSRISLARQFMEVTKKTKVELAINAIAKDAEYYQFVYINDKGEFKNNETGGIYGTTLERVVTHLQNPAYENELDNIKTRVEQKWND